MFENVQIELLYAYACNRSRQTLARCLFLSIKVHWNSAMSFACMSSAAALAHSRVVTDCMANNVENFTIWPFTEENVCQPRLRKFKSYTQDRKCYPKELEIGIWDVFITNLLVFSEAFCTM